MTHLSNEQIQSLVEDPLPDEGQMEHLAQCKECMDSYQAILKVHESLTMLEYERPSMRFAKSIYEMISRRQAIESKERRWIKVIQFTIFSSIFFSIFISFYLMSSVPIDVIINDSSLTILSDWSIILLVSTIILLLLYTIDRWFSVKKSK